MQLYTYENPQGGELVINKIIQTLSELEYEDSLGNIGFIFDKIYPIVERNTSDNDNDAPMLFVGNNQYLVTNPSDKDKCISFFWLHDAQSTEGGYQMVYDLSLFVWYYEGLFSRHKRTALNISEFVFSKLARLNNDFISNAKLVSRDETWADFDSQSFLFQDAPYNAFRIRFEALGLPTCGDILQLNNRITCLNS